VPEIDDDPQDPSTWLKRAQNDLDRARNLAAQDRRSEESAAMTSAGVASLIAARSARYRGEQVAGEWEEALALLDLADSLRHADELQADYYRDQAIHHALLEALRLENQK
jgi:hypothetical protein